ncbi:hypothetical protein [Methylibium rhizosphaerae]|uniref:hypothetical protein n=1 Tax=Methylibium rhizosphaerae TaxID=2570323 RepID=UPI001125F809|nr:hypothetical protein [Methylibium rhizosphaerae]
MPTPLRWLWRALRGVAVGLLAALVFLEEWGWRPLSAALGRLAKWPPLAWLEARIRNAPPAVALVLFLLPTLLLFPVKLAALWFIQQGHAAFGLAVIVAAKLAGTALVGRLFVLTQPQLMRYAWFARALAWWVALKARVGAAVRGWALWQQMRRLGQRMRAWWRLRMRSSSSLR